MIQQAEQRTQDIMGNLASWVISPGNPEFSLGKRQSHDDSAFGFFPNRKNHLFHKKKRITKERTIKIT
jgi:hypothetical protein